MRVIVSEHLMKAAELIATLAHKGQYDEDGVPYINHPKHVAGLVHTPEEKIVALLHDVIEDTEITEEDLRPIFGDTITDAVILLTRDKEEPYFTYIERLAPNSISRKVKLADLTHNMDLSRAKVITEKKLKRNEKYHKAYDFLMEIEKKA